MKIDHVHMTSISAAKFSRIKTHVTFSHGHTLPHVVVNTNRATMPHIFIHIIFPAI